MTLQYINDSNGNPTGIFMPIDQWKNLKNKYVDLQIEESQSDTNLFDWQKEILDERLEDYYKNPTDVVDFQSTISNIKKSI